MTLGKKTELKWNPFVIIKKLFVGTLDLCLNLKKNEQKHSTVFITLCCEKLNISIDNSKTSFEKRNHC